MSLPALEHLRAAYTEVWVASQNVPLIRFADRVRAISSTGLDLAGLDGIASPVFSDLGAFDEIVSWYGSNRPDFRSAVEGLPFVFHDALPPDASMHATDFYLHQVGAPLGATPRIPCDVPREPFIAIHPFSGSPRKNWPLEPYRELASRLPVPVKFCAGPEQELEGAVRIPGLYNLAQWLASAVAYIGNDSGITHLAAAVGTPVLALFGPTDPRVWAPRGPVRVLQRELITELTVEEVLAEISI